MFRVHLSDYLTALLRRTERHAELAAEASRAACDHLNRVDLPARFNRLERMIMATFAETSADLDTVTTQIADRMSARDALIVELRTAVQNGDTARAQALAAQDASHADVMAASIERLRGLGADQDNPVPDTTPLPEAPPADAGGSEPVADGEPLPEAPADPNAGPTG